MKLAMIGAGRMGGTILRMLKGAGSWSLAACEPDSKGREALSKEMGKGVKFVEKVEELGEAEVILLAVKPAMLKDVAGWLQSRKSSYLLISILAGVTTEKLAKEAGGKAKVVRAMPNQALRVGEGVTAICAGSGAKKEDLEVARKIFALGGTVLEIGEEQMDVVTALRRVGSGIYGEVGGGAGKSGGTGGVGFESSGGASRENDVGDGGSFGEGGNEAGGFVCGGGESWGNDRGGLEGDAGRGDGGFGGKGDECCRE